MANDNGITIGQLTEQLNQKMYLPTGVSQDNMDYVVEWKTPTADDPTWFRKYKSGWIEQGGHWQPTVSKTYVTITLPKEMANASYYVNIMQADQTKKGSTEAQYYNSVKTFNHTNTSFQAATGLTELPLYRWEVKGQGAE